MNIFDGTIQDGSRMVACGLCKFAQPVGAWLQDLSNVGDVSEGFCPRCDSHVCAFCGCTEETACVDEKNGRVTRCSWQELGMCDFCHYELAANAYFAVTDATKVVKFKDRRPLLI